VPSRVIRQGPLYGDQSDDFRWLELVYSYILSKKSPISVSDQADYVSYYDIIFK
jgi:hypothetical protein